jgi:hypothetical protein
MSWVDDELAIHRVDEKKKDSNSIGSASLYKVRVEVDGTLMITAVYAENARRAKTIAETLFGKGKIRGLPVKG